MLEMSDRLDVTFAAVNADPEATCVVLAADGLELGSRAREIDAKSAGAIAKAAAAADYKGKYKSFLEVLAPPKTGIDRVIIAGLGKPSSLSEQQVIDLGGAILANVQSRKGATASVIVDIAQIEDMTPERIAALIGFGAQLRHYNFRKYLTRKHSEDGDKDGLKKLIIQVAHPDKAKAAYGPMKAVGNGVNFARDLVNEPANILGPVELAEKTRALEKLGVEVEIFDVKEMEKLKMGSLLCVGQGSARPSRMAVMVWNGAKGTAKKSKPICFVGKGVIFDTGGISIKAAQGMEDMKGDMGGAAAVIGLMHALAERKANVNAVGLIGCVENMPSGSAVRPGDIVTSMSGQTIEVINTDAEGRLVLADVLWYAQETYKPKLIIDLATLTGAIMVALGKEYAGMFASDDELSDQLSAASKATGEKLWRMPLDKAYDKMMDSKNADMKNTGGRWAGSCTAAAFIQRFIKDNTPWVHLDVAGMAMDGAKNDINVSWGSGWGVRLLDRFVAEFHEKG